MLCGDSRDISLSGKNEAVSAGRPADPALRPVGQRRGPAAERLRSPEVRREVVSCRTRLRLPRLRSVPAHAAHLQGDPDPYGKWECQRHHVGSEVLWLPQQDVHVREDSCPGPVHLLQHQSQPGEGHHHRGDQLQRVRLGDEAQEDGQGIFPGGAIRPHGEAETRAAGEVPGVCAGPGILSRIHPDPASDRRLSPRWNLDQSIWRPRSYGEIRLPCSESSKPSPLSASLPPLNCLYFPCPGTIPPPRPQHGALQLSRTRHRASGLPAGELSAPPSHSSWENLPSSPVGAFLTVRQNGKAGHPAVHPPRSRAAPQRPNREGLDKGWQCTRSPPCSCSLQAPREIDGPQDAPSSASEDNKTPRGDACPPQPLLCPPSQRHPAAAVHLQRLRNKGRCCVVVTE